MAVLWCNNLLFVGPHGCVPVRSRCTLTDLPVLSVISRKSADRRAPARAHLGWNQPQARRRFGVEKARGTDLVDRMVYKWFLTGRNDRGCQQVDVAGPSHAQDLLLCCCRDIFMKPLKPFRCCTQYLRVCVCAYWSKAHEAVDSRGRQNIYGGLP